MKKQIVWLIVAALIISGAVAFQWIISDTTSSFNRLNASHLVISDSGSSMGYNHVNASYFAGQLLGAYGDTNFTTKYLTMGYYTTTNHSAETHSYIGNCSAQDSCSLVAYQTDIIGNCSADQSCANVIYTTDKLGNTTAEIRAQFSGGQNISIVNGIISINMSFSSLTGSSDLSGLDIVNRTILLEYGFINGTGLPNVSMQQINDSIGNWSQFLATYPNIDTDSTNDLIAANLTGYWSSYSDMPYNSTTCTGTDKISNVSITSSGLEIYCTADNTGSGADYTVIQNTTATFVTCPTGEVVKGRWQNGTFNCTTDQTGAAGSGDPNSLTNTDNIYIYNNSGVVTFNETKLNRTTNASIDNRVTASFLQNLLDSIYVAISDAVNWDKNVADDFNNNNFTTQYYGITSRYDKGNFSTNYATSGYWTALNETYNTSAQMQAAINQSSYFYDISASDLICTDCIGGTEIAELADADVSDTLTCSDLVAGSEVVADTEVADDITVATNHNITVTGSGITLHLDVFNSTHAKIWVS